jgi:hypothetical protein
MYTEEGKNRAGERIALNISNEAYYVLWFGLCGYDIVELPVESAEEARKLYEALLFVGDVGAD